MMIKSILFSSIGLIVFSAFSFNIMNIDFKNIQNEKKTIAVPEFTKERQFHQWEMLRDPKTGIVPKNIRTLENQFVNSVYGSFNKLKSKQDFLQSEKWMRRGPYEVGGRTRALGLDIRNENIILAGGVSGGMWRSIDAGQTWEKTTLPHQLHSVTCLVQDTRVGKEDIWYAGTGELYGNSADITGDGIFKSTDNGSTWNIIPSTSTNKPQTFDNPFDYVTKIVINTSAANDKDELYVSLGYNGIYRSLDGGVKWNKILGGAQYANIWSEIEITSSGIFYATLSSISTPDQFSTQGIYRSVDGTKWDKIHPQNFGAKYNRIVIGIAPSDENQVYFIGETPGSGLLTLNSRGDSLYHSLWKYTYLSGDGTGENGIWEDRSMNLPNHQKAKGRMNSQGGYDLDIKVKPDNSDVVFIAAVAMYRSNDGFKTGDYTIIGGICPFEECDYQWRYPNHHADVHTLVFSRNDYNILYTGSDGGVHKTIDCMADIQDWISLNNGYFTTQFYALAIDHSNKNNEIVVGGLQDNGTLLSLKNDLKKEWNNPTKGDGFFCQIPNGAEYVITSQNSTPQPKISIWRTILNDNGTNLIQTRIDPVGGKDFIWNTPFVLDPNETNRLYVAGGKMIWRNNDIMEIPLINSKDSTSINWDSLNYTRIDYLVEQPRSEHISAIKVSTNPANVLYYGTTKGKLYRIDDAHIGNPEPIEITGKSFPTNAYIGSIAIDPDNAQIASVSFTNYGVMSIFHTTDAGLTWNAISGNLEERPDGSGVGPGIKWIEILKVKDKKIYYAGTTAGLFSTAFINEESTVWRQEGATTIGNVPVDMIDVRHTDGYVVVGTHGAGIYQAYINELPQLPEKTSLISPINLTIHILDKSVFNWNLNSTAGVYEIQISQDENFNTIDTIIGGIKNGTIEITKFKQGFIKYYWRVRAINDAGYSDFSEVWSFTTAIAPPQLLYPENTATAVSINAKLIWNSVDNSQKYRLQVSSGVGFYTILIDTIISYTIFQLSDLQQNKRHNWRLTSFYEDKESEYSNPFYFMSEKVIGVEKGIENNIKLIAYPNPSKDFTTINYEIIESGSVMLELIGQDGKIIQKLVNEFKDAGNYYFELKSRNLASGLYFLRLISGEKTIMKSVSIIK